MTAEAPTVFVGRPVTEPRSHSPAPTISFIGLGRMGLPMACRLVDAGYHVRGYDSVADATQRADAAGVPVVDSLDKAAAASIVVLMLPTSSVVQRVVEDPTFDAALRPGTVIVDMGS